MESAISLKEIMNTELGGFSLGHIITAVIIFIICVIVTKVLMAVVKRIVDRSKLDGRVSGIATTVIKVVLYVLTIILVCSTLGINTASIVALLSVVSLGITMASENVLSNIAAGIVLLVTRPFTSGDYIIAGDLEGTVLLVKLNYTTILKPDGVKVYVPNKDISSARVSNCTQNGTRRVEIKVGASYEADTEDVKKACLDAVDTQKQLVINNPEPVVYITSYGENTLEYTIFFWTKPEDWLKAKTLVNEAIRESFKKNGVDMSYAHINVHIMEDKK